MTGRSICPSGMACFLGTMSWKGAPVSQMHDRSMLMASSVSAYKMLSLLPPSISTLVSRFMLMIESTTSGYLFGCGTLLGWSVRSKVMVDSDHQRKEGMASSVV